jgi:hypothetical protein
MTLVFGLLILGVVVHLMRRGDYPRVRPAPVVVVVPVIVAPDDRRSPDLLPTACPQLRLKPR